MEDVAGWGIARKIFSSSRDGEYTTVRRAFGSWDGYHSIGPKRTYTYVYKNTHMIVENSIGTWTGKRMKKTYVLGCQSNMSSSKCGKTMTNYAIDQAGAVMDTDRIANTVTVMETASPAL